MKKFDQFHDGYLDGLLIEGPEATVFLSTEQRVPFVLEIGNLLSLKAGEFRQGNIIYDVLVRDAGEITVQDMIEFFEFKDVLKAQKKLEEARQQNLLVLDITPSYGASCQILASSVGVASRESWNERAQAASTQSSPRP
jgi:hypothetical protein